AEGENAWGGVTVDRMQIAGVEGADLTEDIRFIQTTDDNPDDQTVIAVPLPQPVAPGETVALDIEFTSTMPKVVARTGWDRRSDGELFFLVAQWFPKLGVYEVPGQRYVPEDAPRGRWSTHQFHANSEFYADFGTYDVTITAPEEYVVGATGVRAEASTVDSMTTVRYVADDVHDFAWTASPAYVEHTDTWRHVDIRVLLQPEHADQAQRHVDAAVAALDRFDAWVGEYPYTTLTLVDGLGGANGMEYPTFITCGTVYMLPEWLRFLELVTVHEFAHQYFYGLLASNEAEEAWMDEGMTSYMEARIMDDAYGPGSAIDFPGLRISDTAFQRTRYAESDPSRGALFTKSWEYEYGDYGKASYPKPATVLFTLEEYLGWETMREVWRTYYDRWRFRHPTTRDFIDVVEEVAGEDLDWFFDQYVYGTAVVDYAIDRVRNYRVDDEATDDADTTATRHRSSVRVQRKEDGTFPMTLRVRFADGTTEEVSWDGQAEWKEFTFQRETHLVEAYLDPENKVRLDVNPLNNRRALDGDDLMSRKAQLKTAVWLQQLFTILAGVL
ncbi:MAG: M1 family peptidase, partial [Bacteroidetes bacterium]|nr:M1 family peptidase [Bacteroidota bacterium]